jgi:hypothetical protein
MTFGCSPVRLSRKGVIVSISSSLNFDAELACPHDRDGPAQTPGLPGVDYPKRGVHAASDIDPAVAGRTTLLHEQAQPRLLSRRQRAGKPVEQRLRVGKFIDVARNAFQLLGDRRLR